MFQGLINKAETEDKQRIELEAQLTQLERSKFTLAEIEKSIKTLEGEINWKKIQLKNLTTYFIKTFQKTRNHYGKHFPY
jgi:hypothetical protein